MIPVHSAKPVAGRRPTWGAARPRRTRLRQGAMAEGVANADDDKRN